MSEKQDLDLDRSLAAGKRPEDPDTGSLFDAATAFKDSLPSEAPGSHMNKALFVQSVAARRRRFGPVRFLAPAIACVLLLAGVAILGRTAVPGDDLYSVRTALQAVGLAESPEEEADARIADANGALTEARNLVASDPEGATRLALDAIADLARARRLLRDETGVARQLSLIATLEDRAINLLVQIESPPPATPGEGDDDSGPGSGDEDNSGPGSGNEDNSGPGGGDEDNSGPGGGGGDNSGPGGGGGDGDDNSGPGGGGDGGSGDGDSSGSGDGNGDNSGPGGGGDSSGSGSGGSGGDSSGPGSGDDADNSGPG